jgi:Ca-activated chloride channel family protein
MKMNTQEFENRSLDLLMGRLTPEEKEQFLSSLSASERADFDEKERIFNLVKKAGESKASPSTGLVDRIMTQVKQEEVKKQTRGFMNINTFKKVAVPSAMTITALVALMLVQKDPELLRAKPRIAIQAEQPAPEVRVEQKLKFAEQDLNRAELTAKIPPAELSLSNNEELEKEVQYKNDKGTLSELSVNRVQKLEAAPMVGAKDEKRRDSLQVEMKVGDSEVQEKKALKGKVASIRGVADMDAAGAPAPISDIPASTLNELDKTVSAGLGARAGNLPSREVAKEYGGFRQSTTILQATSLASTYSPSTNSIEGDRYGQYEELGPILTSTESTSTFSIDVDTGGYTNIRKMIQSGTLPPQSAVRVEEMINYFDYTYPESPGAEPFSFSYEAAPSPFDSSKVFLKLGIKAKAAQVNEDQGWNLVFLVDVSGSMNEQDKLPLLKDSMKVFVEHMRPQDRLSIVTYAGNAGVVLEPTSGNQKDKIFGAINQLGAGGSTNGSGGIMAAYQQAELHKIKDGVNRVILATDGDFNVGVSNFDGLVKLIEEKRKTGITLTTLGVGRGNYNEQNLEQLADKGNGNYFYLDSLDEASRVLGSKLASNMEMVAKDVKLQIEFNPSKVTAYRLIGYDNRNLRNEDFKNDAIDAGEIGAGHTVTAIYELVLNGSKAAEALKQDEKRYAASKVVSNEGESISELAFLKIRYKAPNEDVSKLLQFPLKPERIAGSFNDTTDDFRFSAAVSGFGQELRGSRFAGDISLGTVKEIASKAIGSDKDGKRKEFLELVNRAMGLK